jgi:hypothetical protein
VPQFERNGLQLKDMTEPQRKLAHELLKTGLSARGYTTYTQIMQLENILKVVENGNGPTRDPEGYRFSVFGTPAAKGTWGWRVEFHHISLSWTGRRFRARRHLPAPIRPKSRMVRRRGNGRSGRSRTRRARW